MPVFRKKRSGLRRKAAKRPVRKMAYRKKRPMSSLAKLSSQVRYLKNNLNIEKKRVTTYLDTVVGQVNGNASGYVCSDLTPALVQGTGQTGMIGNSVRVTGLYISGQFLQQSNTNDSNRFIVEIWIPKKQIYSPISSAVTDLYNLNYFSGFHDAMSRRNQNHYSDFVCLRRKVVSVGADQVSTMTRGNTFQLKLKMNKTVRLDSLGNLIEGQFFLLIRTEKGNCSTSVTNTSSLALQNAATSTGWRYLHEQIVYYVDN